MDEERGGERSLAEGGSTDGSSLTHARLLVRDVGACLRFYRDQVGLDVLWGDEEGNYASFKTGDVILALNRQDSMAEALGTLDRPGQVESCDRVALIFAVEDVDAEYQALRGKGVAVVARPADRPEWGLRTAHFRDPAGNLIEINAPL